jgi:hypothetical protein
VWCEADPDHLQVVLPERKGDIPESRLQLVFVGNVHE